MENCNNGKHKWTRYKRKDVRGRHPNIVYCEDCKEIQIFPVEHKGKRKIKPVTIDDLMKIRRASIIETNLSEFL